MGSSWKWKETQFKTWLQGLRWGSCLETAESPCVGFISHLNNIEQIAQILGIISLDNKHWSHFVRCHQMALLILFCNKSQADGTLKRTMQFGKQDRLDIFVWLAKIMCWGPRWKVLGVRWYRNYTPFREFVLTLLQSKSWFLYCWLWLSWFHDLCTCWLKGAKQGKRELLFLEYLLCVRLFPCYLILTQFYGSPITPILSIKKLRSGDIPHLIRSRAGIRTLIWHPGPFLSTTLW